MAVSGFLGWIIGDYSRRYLDGEPRQQHYVSAFLLTLAAAGGVIAAQHFAVQILAWTLSSVGLHGLLTFYDQRPAALLAARKKFLVSRCADVLLVLAAVLIWSKAGSLQHDAVLSALSSTHDSGFTWQLAALALALAALLKAAQLPTHGWLIQVMEAPTPVSALLHAGVVNLSGLVLIQWAALLEAAVIAQALLVGVGSLTALIAGMVMLTRITIKVRLAWSTVSQMGLMIMECGLGLYDLALLHLLAHSLYKAHAFLSAGEAVRAGDITRLIARRIAPSTEHSAQVGNDQRFLTAPQQWLTNQAMALRLLSSVLLAAVIVTGSLLIWQRYLALAPIAWVAALILVLGLSTLGWHRELSVAALWQGLFTMFAATQLYLAWHWLLHALHLPTYQAPLWLSLWVALAFVIFYLLQAAVFFHRLVARAAWYEWLYAGVHLDEWLSHITRRIWPARITVTAHTHNTSTHPRGA